MDPPWTLEPRISNQPNTRVVGPGPIFEFPTCEPVCFDSAITALQASMAIEPSLCEPSGISVNLLCPVQPAQGVILFYPAGREEGLHTEWRQ